MQVLANFTAIQSDSFATEFLPGRTKALGSIDMDKVG